MFATDLLVVLPNYSTVWTTEPSLKLYLLQLAFIRKSKRLRAQYQLRFGFCYSNEHVFALPFCDYPSTAQRDPRLFHDSPSSIILSAVVLLIDHHHICPLTLELGGVFLSQAIVVLRRRANLDLKPVLSECSKLSCLLWIILALRDLDLLSKGSKSVCLLWRILSLRGKISILVILII